MPAIAAVGPPAGLADAPGRPSLPEYRALKEKYTFLELVQTPELAAEVTLAAHPPVWFRCRDSFQRHPRRVRSLGAALPVSGQGRHRNGFPAQDRQPTSTAGRRQRSTNVCNTWPRRLRLIKQELGGKTALIGFAGSPWTLANFMLEGGGVKEYTKAKALFYSEP